MQRLSSLIGAVALTLSLSATAPAQEDYRFERIQLYPVRENNPALPRTAAEIVAVTSDGKTLIYADSLGGGVGFVDVSDPKRPKALGWKKLDGEPTSVTMKGHFALVVTATEVPFQGALQVFDMQTQEEVAKWSIPGQPDSIDLSPDKRFGAICLENESSNRNFPESPPGSLIILKLDGAPKEWTFTNLSLSGLAEVAPEDPEPEYVAINDENLAVVTLQENNHIVLVDLESEKIVRHFSAGSEALKNIDLKKDKRISFTQSSSELPREPDSVEWCSLGIVTADEGDYQGGTRSFTIFSPACEIVHWSGNQTDTMAANLGQYPDHRSSARGTEPESLAVATFEGREFLFVGTERANLVFVYEIKDGAPQFFQALYAGPGPESIVAAPDRNLLFLGSEVNEPEHGLHSYLSIFRFGPPNQDPHHISSTNVPWQSLSGLTYKDGKLYAVADKALRPSSIFSIDPLSLELKRHHELLEDLDLEGISAASDGGFWLVAEGKKKKPNLLLKVSSEGEWDKIALPEWLPQKTSKHGLEGVAEVGNSVFVIFQSAWKGDPANTTRIGRYSTETKEWDFALYPLQSGHFATGLCAGPEGTLAILERDKEARQYAQHKAIFVVKPEDFGKQSLSKTKIVDLVEEFRKRDLPVVSKLEGLTWDGKHFWVVNDNDGVKDSYGETILLKVEPNHPSKES